MKSKKVKLTYKNPIHLLYAIPVFFIELITGLFFGIIFSLLFAYHIFMLLIVKDIRPIMEQTNNFLKK